MKQLKMIVCILFVQVGVYAQISLGGGFSSIKPFGGMQSCMGVHVFGELPKDDLSSLFLRVGMYEKIKDPILGNTTVFAIDPATTPAYQVIGFENSMNYTVIEGGNRYYVGDGYDSGFGAYGGGTAMVMFNTVKRDYDDYDQSLYKLNDSEAIPRGSIFNLGLGLGRGLKNTFAGVGTLYLDVHVNYLIRSQPSNSVAQSVGNSLYSPLLFSFNLGFRKDLY